MMHVLAITEAAVHCMQVDTINTMPSVLWTSRVYSHWHACCATCCLWGGSGRERTA
jgi:hypothetical protein